MAAMSFDYVMEMSTVWLSVHETWKAGKCLANYASVMLAHISDSLHCTNYHFHENVIKSHPKCTSQIIIRELDLNRNAVSLHSNSVATSSCFGCS